MYTWFVIFMVSITWLKYHDVFLEFQLITAYVILSIMWQFTSMHIIALEWRKLYRI
jgi:hypothetical protein